MSSHRRDRDSHDRQERRKDRSDSPDTRRRFSPWKDDLDQYQEKQIRIRPHDDTRRDRHESERRRSSHKDERDRSNRHREQKSRKRSKKDRGTPSDDEDLLDIRALGISPITEEDY
jgi:hypothetical protein